MAVFMFFILSWSFIYFSQTFIDRSLKFIPNYTIKPPEKTICFKALSFTLYTFPKIILNSTLYKPLKKTAMKNRTNGYGWVPDLPDHRDQLFSAPLSVLAKLPPSTDLTKKCPPVYNQGQLGSCTANAIGAAIEFDHKKQKLPKLTPSRLFIYYNERVMENTVNSDSGAMIRDGIKSVNKQGNCPESMWPYNINKFSDKPTNDCYKEGLKHRAVSYQRLIPSLNQLKGCIASGFPFVFGFTVYESFESPKVAQNGIVPMPSTREKVLGGHAVMAVGYDDTSQRFIVRNSWGKDWGKKGYFTMPYPYLTDSNLSDDFWTIRIVQ
jgi:C1A family cysteine protease